MNGQLEMFEGFEVDAAELRLTGSVGSSEALRIGDEVKLSVTARVIGITHEPKGSKPTLFVRSHKLQVEAAEVQ